MLNFQASKRNKVTRVFLISLGAVVISIACVNPASANDTVSLNETTPYIDFQVHSGGGSYEIRVVGDDPVVQLYRGTSRSGFDLNTTSPSGDFLAVDDDSGGGDSGYDSLLSGVFGYGLDNYIIRVTSFDYWVGLTPPTESYTLSFSGFSRGKVEQKQTIRQTHNLSFANSLYGSDTLSDEDGELRKTVDQIMNRYGSLIK